MDEGQQNSEIEKIANLMVHDDISHDEQDLAKLEKYKNIIKEDCNLDDDKAMKLVYETLLFRKLKNSDSGDILEKGNEFGATTGRPRRCGWIDIPQLKYTIMLNGVTQLVVTKIDILNNFEKISVGTHYEYNGQQTEQLPYDICTVPVSPVYQEYKGWMSSLEDISESRDNMISGHFKNNFFIGSGFVTVINHGFQYQNITKCEHIGHNGQ